jgi:hypothetical protein
LELVESTVAPRILMAFDGDACGMPGLAPRLPKVVRNVHVKSSRHLMTAI